MDHVVVHKRKLNLSDEERERRSKAAHERLSKYYFKKGDPSPKARKGRYSRRITAVEFHSLVEKLERVTAEAEALRPAYEAALRRIEALELLVEQLIGRIAPAPKSTPAQTWQPKTKV